jgi:O-acetylserine/cysteine efflux transporter
MTFLPKRDLLLALAVVLIWGAHFIVIKAGVSQIAPMVALTLRFGLTALVFLPFAPRPDKRTFKKIAEIGILMGVCHQGLLFMGLQRLDPSSVAVLIQSQIIFAVLLGYWLLGEKFYWRTTLGLLVSGAGLLVMLGVPDVHSSPAGLVMILASALVLAFSYVRMRQLSRVHPITFIAYLNLVSAPLAAIASIPLGGVQAWAHLPDINWAVMGGVLAYQVFIVSFSHVWWQQLLSRNEVAKITSFNLLSPPIAIAISVAFLGTKLTLPLVAGAGLIAAGLAVVIIRRAQLGRKAPVTLVE